MNLHQFVYILVRSLSGALTFFFHEVMTCTAEENGCVFSSERVLAVAKT